MNKKECLKKLEEFRELVVEWNHLDYLSTNRSELRTKINKNIIIVNKIIYVSGCLKIYTISPPPLLGGIIYNNINPFNIIFDPPYQFNAIKAIIDMIDSAIGVIENENEFSLESKNNYVNDKSLVNIDDNNSSKIFVVHGHDNEMKETVARFLEKIELEPVILHEKPNKGLTIIEKFIENSIVPFAVVLMSPDDLGNLKEKKDELLNRARQNVIFELGYFIGKLGRNKVCVLMKDNIEKPTDYDGIIYIPYDKNEGWKTLLAKELKTSGLFVDMNKILK